MHVIAFHLHRKGQETGDKFLFITEEQNLLNSWLIRFKFEKKTSLTHLADDR